LDTARTEDVCIGQVNHHFVELYCRESHLPVKVIDQHVRDAGESETQDQAVPVVAGRPVQAFECNAKIAVQIAETIDGPVGQQLVASPVQDHAHARIERTAVPADRNLHEIAGPA